MAAADGGAVIRALSWFLGLVAGRPAEQNRYRPLRDARGRFLGAIDPSLAEPSPKIPIDLERYRLERRPVDLDNRVNKAKL